MEMDSVDVPKLRHKALRKINGTALAVNKNIHIEVTPGMKQDLEMDYDILRVIIGPMSCLPMKF